MVRVIFRFSKKQKGGFMKTKDFFKMYFLIILIIICWIMFLSCQLDKTRNEINVEQHMLKNKKEH